MAKRKCGREKGSFTKTVVKRSQLAGWPVVNLAGGGSLLAVHAGLRVVGCRGVVGGGFGAVLCMRVSSLLPFSRGVDVPARGDPRPLRVPSLAIGLGYPLVSRLAWWW